MSAARSVAKPPTRSPSGGDCGLALRHSYRAGQRAARSSRYRRPPASSAPCIKRGEGPNVWPVYCGLGCRAKRGCPARQHQRLVGWHVFDSVSCSSSVWFAAGHGVPPRSASFGYSASLGNAPPQHGIEHPKARPIPKKPPSRRGSKCRANRVNIGGRCHTRGKDLKVFKHARRAF